MAVGRGGSWWLVGGGLRTAGLISIRNDVEGWVTQERARATRASVTHPYLNTGPSGFKHYLFTIYSHSPANMKLSRMRSPLSSQKSRASGESFGRRIEA